MPALIIDGHQSQFASVSHQFPPTKRNSTKLSPGSNMKIFTTILLASVALSAGELNINTGYNYNGQQPLYPLMNQQPIVQQQQPFLMQLLSNHQAAQQQFTLPPSTTQRYRPQSHAHPSMNGNNMPYPMPIGFPAVPNFQPPKTSRRPRPRVKITKKPIVTKNFFIHAAPEESEDEIQEELSQLAQQPRKHYNVLFVKTPAQTSKAAALNLAKALKEEKTVVYVLSKKTSASDLQDAIAEAPQHINKPDVFFIKYRTPEEAANAQRQIQSQYDSLGGSSTITDEGIAPITSVVGSLDPSSEEEEDSNEELGDQQQPQQYDEQLVNSINNIGGSSGSVSNNQYLPPSGQY